MSDPSCGDRYCGARHFQMPNDQETTTMHRPTTSAVTGAPIPASDWVDAVEHARHSPYAERGPAVVVVLTGDPAPRVATALARDVRTMVRQQGWPVLADLVGTGTYVDAVEYADAVVVEIPDRQEYASLVGRLVAIGYTHGQATVGLVGVPDAWRYGGRHVGTLVHCADPGAPAGALLLDHLSRDPGQEIHDGPVHDDGPHPWPAYRGHVNAEHAPTPDPGAPDQEDPQS